MIVMNIISFNFKLWRDWYMRYQKQKVDRHLTKAFYFSLDEAIQKCLREPRKYYLLQDSVSSYQVVGSQELKKLRKFPEVRKDVTFIDLHEKAFVVCPENVKRLVHEQKRRKYFSRWWNTISANYYFPVTKGELLTLRKSKNLLRSCLSTNSELYKALDAFIKKHE